MSVKEDRRIKYTKMALRQSLLELMKKQPIFKITVTDICANADINRNTFYSHYSSPEDLLWQIEEELYNDIKQSVERSLKTETISTFINEICLSIADNGDLCKILFSEYGDKEFLKRIMYIARDKSLQEWKNISKDIDTHTLEKLYTFIANGAVALIQVWIQDGMKQSPQEVAMFIDQLTIHGLYGMLKNKAFNNQKT